MGYKDERLNELFENSNKKYNDDRLNTIFENTNSDTFESTNTNRSANNSNVLQNMQRRVLRTAQYSAQRQQKRKVEEEKVWDNVRKLEADYKEKEKWLLANGNQNNDVLGKTSEEYRKKQLEMQQANDAYKNAMAKYYEEYKTEYNDRLTKSNKKSLEKFPETAKKAGLTVADAGFNVIQGGITDVSEAIADAGTYAVAQAYSALGDKNTAERLRRNAQTNIMRDRVFGTANEYLAENSYLGDTGRAVASGIGQSATLGLLNVIPGASTGVLATSALGNSLNEAYATEGISDAKAWTKAGLSAGLEVGVEKLFSLAGYGGSSIEDRVMKSTEKISNALVKTLVQTGITATGEGVEEMLSYAGNYLIDHGLDLVDKNGKLSKDWDNEELWENFFVGAISSGITQGAINSYNYIKNRNSQNYVNEENRTVKNNQYDELNSTHKSELNNMLNNKDLPMQYYQYENSGNKKVDILRQDAGKYFNNSAEARNYISMLEKIVTDKNIEIRFDGNLTTSDGRIARGSYNDGVITINPNSSGTGEFIAIHELTHAIGTKEMLNIVENYRKSNGEFDASLNQLLNNYKSAEITEESLADVSAQLFGTQEFINNVADAHPTLFQKIYSEIKYLWHQFRGYKNQNQFVEDLYYKWNQAYNSSNKLNKNNSFSVQTDSSGNKYVKIDTDQNIFAKLEKKDYNKMAKMYIQEYLIGKTQLSDNDSVIIDKKSANKYTNPGKKQQNFDEKMKLTPELKNVLEIAQKTSDSAPIKDTSKYKSWEYYKFNFELSGKNFEGTINIGVDSNGNKHFYEINKIKELDDISGTSLNRSSNSSINSSIAPQNSDVNTSTKYSMQESKNNSESFSIQDSKVWRDYIDKSLPTKGTRTYLKDILVQKSSNTDSYTKAQENRQTQTIQSEGNSRKQGVEDSTSFNMNESLKSQNVSEELETGEWTKQKKEGEKRRKHYESIIRSNYTTDEARAIAKNLIGNDTYVPESNIKQLQIADERISTAGADSELSSLLSRATTGSTIKSEDIAVGERLIQYYSKTGDKLKLQDAIQATAMAGTTAGQTVQAMSLLNHQTPEGQAVWLQRSVDKMNKNLKVIRGENAEQFKLTPEMLNKIANSENSKVLEQNLNEVYKELGQQVTKTTSQKIDAWRYFSMLANPRTHIRNIVGNTAMGGVQGIKNKVAGGIESVVNKINPDIERNHTLIPANKEVRAFAKADIENVVERLGLNENKYNPKTRLENNMRTFKSDVMENTIGKAFDLNNKALEAEDGWGLKSGYVKALSEYMTANKLTPNNITDQQLGKARNFAVEQAKEATFHQDSQLASLINQLSNKNKFSKFVLDATLPFKKTPINVAKTGIEYSPVGLIKSAVLDTANLRKGNITVNQYIDNVSKGLTGTGIALVGYALANCGVLKASGSEDKDREEFEESRGSQNYSITIGDNTYSLDWLAPSGIPLFIGAECYELMQASKEKKTSSSDEDEVYNQVVESATNILDSFANAMNPMTEMSMLSGLTSSLKSYDQGSSQMLASIGTNAVKSYVNQFAPTLLGQIAKTTDKYERSTTSTKTGVLPKAIDSTKNQIMSKIPGLRQQLPIKTDTWGNDMKQSENILLRTLENSVLPWTRKELNSTLVDKELLNVYENTGESSVFPDSINKNITINKQKYSLTSEEYAKYKKQYGQTSYKSLNGLIKSSDYKKMSDSEKQFAIDKIYSYATEQIKVDYAKQNNLEYEQSTLSQTTNSIKEAKGDTSYYFEYLAQTQELDKNSEKIKVLASSKADNKTKQVIYENSLGKEDKKYQVVKDAFTSNGLDITQYLEYKSQEFTSDTTDDGTVNGKTISGSKKQKVYNYIESMKATYTQKLILSALEYKPTSYSDKKLIINYVNSLNKTAKEKLEILGQFKGVTIYKNGTYSY